jgi:ABC-type multidrug transport system permease subunit
MGGVFEVICEILPFEACLNIIQGTLHNDFSNLTLVHIIVFLIYFIAVLLLSIIVFKKRMVSDNK